MDKKELNNLIDRISLTGPEGTKKIKKVLKEIAENGVDKIDEILAIIQEQTGEWRDPFIWNYSLTWPGKKSGGGDSTVSNALKTMPTFRKKWKKNGFCYYEVDHPMIDNDGAEVVLMRYAKKNGKKHRVDGKTVRRYKKGFGLACGEFADNPYFVFSKVTQASDFADFCDNYLSDGALGRHFGIALRIPNPDYDGPETSHKNATYKGVPESLYSDVLPVKVAYDDDGDTWGIGLI